MGSTRQPRWYLSVVGEDDSVSESIKLPFDDEDHYSVEGGRCGELLYFHDGTGQIVLFNSTSKEFKVLPSPDYDPEPAQSDFNACGLGYDAKSQDYKVIRSYTQHFLDEWGQNDPYNFEDPTELYSFKSGSWKEIETPDAGFHQSNGVYVGETGSCYWVAALGRSFGIPEEREGDDLYVLSFDFATESFAHFALPVTTSKLKHPYFTLVECGGLLGAIGRMGSFPCPMELYVRKGQLWNRLYNVSFADVDRVLGIKDDQLMVFDWLTKRWKKLIVYDYRTIVNVGLCLSVASNDLLQLRSDSKPLRDSKPKTRKMWTMKNCSTRGKRKRVETVLKRKTTFEITERLE